MQANMVLLDILYFTEKSNITNTVKNLSYAWKGLSVTNLNIIKKKHTSVWE